MTIPDDHEVKTSQPQHQSQPLRVEEQQQQQKQEQEVPPGPTIEENMFSALGGAPRPLPRHDLLRRF
jgi:hypothetical protein